VTGIAAIGCPSCWGRFGAPCACTDAAGDDAVIQIRMALTNKGTAASASGESTHACAVRHSDSESTQTDSESTQTDSESTQTVRALGQ